MLFNSIQFLVFFPLTLLLFYLLPVRYRWLLLLVSSVYFYMAWKPEYILLLLAVCLVNFIGAVSIERSDSVVRRKAILWVTLGVDLATLFMFKYYGFFAENLGALLYECGITWESPAVRLLLPMGISFYTFQIMGYVVDVYRNELKAERNFGFFTLFVTFFPQLVAGPIERAGNLIAQLKDLRNKIDANAVATGFSMMCLGFFKKLVIADRLSMYVDKVYIYPEGFEGIQVLLATLFFSIQIYCDFSGYTDIAIGCALLMGVRLMDNFKTPYLSASVSEFWSRWHISLSSWFRDYLYIPLGGNRVVKWRWYYNLYITFIISGFWHGANWTFLVWGGLHGTYLVSGLILRRWGFLQSWFDNTATWNRWFQVFLTFILVCFAWIFFRSNSIETALTVIQKISYFCTSLDLQTPVIKGFGVFALTLSVFSVVLLLILEAVFYNRWQQSIPFKLTLSAILIGLVLCFGVMGSKSFIYFQF